MPTFMIFKNGRETQRIRGADTQALGKAVKSLADEASSADASGSGSGSCGQWLGSSLPRGYDEVTTSVDQKGLDFLNLSSEAGNSKAIFSASQPKSLGKAKSAEGDIDYVESDTDDQLMMFIPFQSLSLIHI